MYEILIYRDGKHAKKVEIDIEGKRDLTIFIDEFLSND